MEPSAQDHTRAALHLAAQAVAALAEATDAAASPLAATLALARAREHLSQAARSATDAIGCLST